MAFLPYVYQSSGIEGAFYGMGLLNLLACGLLPFLPATVAAPGETSSASPIKLERGVLVLSSLVLASFFLHYLFNSGLWTYFERLGVAFGMSPERAGALLGLRACDRITG